MSKKRDLELYYAGAAVKVEESKAPASDFIDRIINAKDYAGAEAIFSELKYAETGEDFDLAIDAEKGRLFNFLTEILSGYGDGEGEEIVTVLRAPYDFHNIKAALKCFCFGVEPNDDFFVDFSPINGKALVRALREKEFSFLPGEAIAAIEEATEASAVSGDPQKLDLIIDKACFAYMLDIAVKSGIGFLEEIVRARIDLTNISIFSRLKRLDKSKALLSDMLFDGGTAEKTAYIEVFDSPSNLSDAIKGSAYGSVLSAVKEDAGEKNLELIEKLCDEELNRKVERARFIPFGPEPVIAYAVNKENFLKNLRIALVGKKVGLSSEEIRSRLRK